MPRPLVLALASILVLAPLAGCLGGRDEPIVTQVTPDGNDTGGADPTLPDGRGESSALKETNVTEQGVGGMEHQHDYWQGREQVVVIERDILLDELPIFPGGEGTSPYAIAYAKIPNSTLVFEGTSRMTIVVSDPRLQGQPHPAPPTVSVAVLTAADAEFREPLEAPYGTPVEIAVAPRETDMPHSNTSLWVFRLTTDQLARVLVKLTVTIHRGAEVLDWPGHPDLYATTKSRVIMEQAATTTRNGLFATVLYDGSGSFVTPEKLISWGTTHLEVYVNVSAFRGSIPAVPTGYYLEFHNATVIGPETGFERVAYDPDEPADLKAYNFTIKVDDYGMDSPYQPTSRWGFRMVATFAEPPAGSTGLCPGCFPYEVDFDIKVVAVQRP